MRRNKLSLYVHLVWATWDRVPLISVDIERRLYRNIESEAQQLGCQVLALNGTDNHVHLFVTLPTTVSIAELVKQIKGVSSHFVNDELRPAEHFKWQGSYGAFTVSHWDVAKVADYIRHQKEHHRIHELWAEYEQTFDEVKIPSAKADGQPTAP